jgi:hypothetical protein
LKALPIDGVVKPLRQSQPTPPKACQAEAVRTRRWTLFL